MTNLIKGLLTGVVVGLLLIAASGYLVVATGMIDPGADQPIPEIERWAAKTSIRAYLKRSLSRDGNPLPSTAANLRRGALLYVSNCASCHGFADGAKSRTAAGMYKEPNIIPTEDWSKDEDSLVYWFISHGVRLTGMPAFNKTLSDREIWQLVMFVKQMRSLPPEVDDYWRRFSHPPGASASPSSR